MKNQQQIREKYIECVLETGSQPATVFAFCKKLKIKENEFYEHYSSFDYLEQDIWASLMDATHHRLEQDVNYGSYSVREKLLAFYYTLAEVLKENRSYILLAYKHLPKPIIKNATSLNILKKSFEQFTQRLLIEAAESREIENRFYLNQHYPKLLWLQLIYILDFWVKDDSRSFEKTDTAIEKIVNTAFDLMAKSPVDSLLDLGKFMFQNTKK